MIGILKKTDHRIAPVTFESIQYDNADKFG